MIPSGGHNPPSFNRRRFRRAKISVPVQVEQGTSEKGVVQAYTGWSKDLSVGGVYVRTDTGGVVAPGEILNVLIAIPLERRRAFPVSRLMGSCRVVRVEEWPDATQEQEKGWGLALAFCEDVTVWGAIVVP